MIHLLFLLLQYHSSLNLNFSQLYWKIDTCESSGRKTTSPTKYWHTFYPTPDFPHMSGSKMTYLLHSCLVLCNYRLRKGFHFSENKNTIYVKQELHTCISHSHILHSTVSHKNTLLFLRVGLQTGTHGTHDIRGMIYPKERKS